MSSCRGEGAEGGGDKGQSARSKGGQEVAEEVISTLEKCPRKSQCCKVSLGLSL